MPVITFLHNGQTVELPEGAALLEAAKLAGIPVEAPCGGHGVCGKCLVKITEGEVEFNNNGMLPSDLIDDGYVLICKTKALSKPISISLISQLEKEQGRFSEASEDIRLIDKGLLPKEYELEPIIKKIFLTVSEPIMADGLSDIDRFKKAVLLKLQGQRLDIPLNTLQSLPEVLREDEGNITVTYYKEENDIKIIDIEAADTTLISYGIAVDIGTTTIAVQLVNMNDATIIAAKTDYNAQIECGLDVISRINYAKKPHRKEELRQKVLQTINTIVNELADRSNIDTRFIYNASIAANTTMVHLLLGIPPEYIRLEPYTPTVYEVPFFKAGDLGIAINANTLVYIAPSVGSYVGGDITSGLLCTSLSQQDEDICLFIDIGTNGELILGNNDFLIGCACSAGPAFEGGGIENGMRASTGAIEYVNIDADTGIADYSTIGDTAPIGICGSGIISLIANLFSTGWIDAAGKLNRQKNCPSIVLDGKNARYIIAPDTSSAKGTAIYITESDIDNLIRAKAAIFSACYVMLEKIGMDFSAVSRIYIAGGFGRYLNIEKSTVIGLIPRLNEDKFKFIGNSSIIGAYMTLISFKHREKQAELAKRITYIDLSTEPDYMNQYTAALFLPHTDSSLF